MLEHIESFFAEKDYSEDTISSYRRHLKRLAQWLDVNGISPNKVKPIDFKAYLDSKNWGDSHRYIALCSFRSFVRYRYGEDHPILQMKIHRRGSKPQRTLSKEQFDKLVASIDRSSPVGIRNLALISLLLDTGLRASEVCRLSLRDFDIEARAFSVLAKGRKWRIGGFSTVTAERIRKWLKIRDMFASPEVDTVFVSVGGITPGRPLTRYGLTMVFRYIAKEVGLKKGLSTHDFRRSHATLSILNGAPTRLVMISGGWEKLETVERYTRDLTIKAFEPYFPTIGQ